MILGRLDETFRNLTLILNVEDDQTTSSWLDKVFRISISILNDEDCGPSSTCLTFLAIIISSGH